MTTPGSRPLVIPIFLPHAGCRQRCVFCDQKAISGQRRGLPALAEISDRIERFLASSGRARHPVEISFYGGNFLGLARKDMERLLAHAGTYVASGQVDSIRFSTRPDTVDPARLDILGHYPVSTVELGVQSMQDAVLASCRRGHTAQDTEAAVALLKNAGYRLGLQIMVGLPGDSEAGLTATGRHVAALMPDFVRIYPTLVLAGSPLAQWYASGRYLPLALTEAIALVKPLYLLFASRGIRVARMGLQDAAALNDGGIVLAGPHHPAFGHLVLSAVCLDRLRELLAAQRSLPRRVQIRVHPNHLSRFQGHRNGHLKTLGQELHPLELSLATDDNLAPNAIALNDGPPEPLFPWLPGV